MLRVLIVTLIGTLAGAAGQIAMRKGMQLMGPLENYAPLAVAQFLGRALLSPWVILGTILSGILYFCLLAVLSWTDVTVAYPLTAIEYFFAAVLAVLFLQENISLTRGAGILLVMVGVALIGFGESPAAGTTAPAADPPDRVDAGFFR